MDNSIVLDDQEQHIADSSPIDESVQEQYRNWKLNSIHLYDYLNTNNLVWPSLTVQFFPDKESNLSNSTKYRLLTSTYTSSDFPIHLQIGNINTKSSIEEVSLDKFDHTLNEFQSSYSNSSFKVDQTLLHNEDVNRARMSPHNPDLISTINNLGEIHIFDKTKYPSTASNDFKYDIRLKEHTKEGFGLSWNNLKEGLLLSGSMDGATKIWNITTFKSGQDLQSLHTITSDQNGTNDVQWNPLHDSIFGTVGEDNIVKIFDQRSLDNPKASTSSNFHTNGINALSFNYQNSFILSTIDSTGDLNIWDLRNTTKPSITIKNAHQGTTSSLQFNPSRPNLLASAGLDDNLVNIWDLSKPNGEQLVFKHGGHLLGVNDFNWNPNDELMIASVSNDNTLQIWKPSHELVV